MLLLRKGRRNPLKTMKKMDGGQRRESGTTKTSYERVYYNKPQVVQNGQWLISQKNQILKAPVPAGIYQREDYLFI